MISARNNILAVFLEVAFLGLAAVFSFSAKVGAQPSSITILASASATTSVAYLTAGTASTTYQFDNPSFSSGKPASVAAVDSTYLYLQAAASSTSSIYIITPQWSNNGTDWYGYAANSGSVVATTGSQLIASSTLSYAWLPGTTATTSTVLPLPVVASQHARVIVGTSGANGAAYMEIVLKKNPSTP